MRTIQISNHAAEPQRFSVAMKVKGCITKYVYHNIDGIKKWTKQTH